MPAPTLAPVLLRAVQAAALNTFIALGITLFGERSFGENFLYSQCIGLSIWALIDLPRLGLVKNWDTEWRRLVLLVPLGVVLGYTVGMLLANTLLGKENTAFLTSEPRKTIGFLAMSLVAGAVATYYFLSREQLAEARAHAEALQRQAAESQLKLLQTQLEPHMLFNTLANLRALIGADPARAQAMLDHMIAYLRATLGASRAATHPLQAEFDRLQDYLELMTVRMGPRLSYTLDLPPALAALPVPTLLLQPLVENSIKHGLEPQVAGGDITVSARQNGGALVLEVLDTGAGLPAAASVAARTGAGFGLAQVRERLATSCGPQSAIDLIASPAGGTLARVTIALHP
ncbi:sensor histidine kinase [Polaromonas sp.]|uniref:sensor histidine kinase n=1 Tax=Polaromonas sp. TaxID=1869339 RepID=UPI002FCBB253